jgi:hypothetical protein
VLLGDSVLTRIQSRTVACVCMHNAVLRKDLWSNKRDEMPMMPSSEAPDLMLMPLQMPATGTAAKDQVLSGTATVHDSSILPATGL